MLTSLSLSLSLSLSVRLTKEFRVNLGNLAKVASEKAKVGIKRARNKAMDDLKKAKSAPANDVHVCGKQVWYRGAANLN